MSRDLLLWLLHAQAYDQVADRRDSPRHDIPTELGRRVLQYVRGGMVGEEASWPGLKGVAPGQRGPADFGLSLAWPPPRPLHAERLSVTTTPQQVASNVYAALGWHGSREAGDERAVIRSVRTPTVLRDVLINHAFVEHVARHPSRGAFANYVLPTLRMPHEVWLTHVGSSSGGVFRYHFLAAFDDGTTAVVAVEPGEAPVAWNFFPAKRRTDIQKRRRGTALYSRNQGELTGARRG